MRKANTKTKREVEKCEGEHTLTGEFYLEEYKALRAEILFLKQYQAATQKWIVVSLGVIYGLAFNIAGTSTILPK